MPSLDPKRIRDEFTEQPNGDIGFTFKVVARKSGVEVNGDLIGPPVQGWASAAEHFGRRLAKLCEADRKRRAQPIGVQNSGEQWKYEERS